MQIVKEQITLKKLKTVAQNQFGDFVKAVVDVEQEIMAIAGELHADEESLLLAHGSQQKNLWGINIWVNKPKKEWVEFDSIINIRPSQNNRSRYVEDALIREKIQNIVYKLVRE